MFVSGMRELLNIEIPNYFLTAKLFMTTVNIRPILACKS